MANAKRAALMAKMAKAKPSGGGNNFRDGKYRLAIKKCSIEDGFKGSRFQCTMTVMDAGKIQVVSPKSGEALNIEPNARFSDVDWLQVKLDQDDQPGAGNVRKFIMDLMDAKELSDDEYINTVADMCDFDENGDAVVPPRNPAKGMVIDMETYRTITKKNKIEIVACKFSHVAQTEEEQARVAVWLDTVTTQQMALAAQQAQLAAQHATLPAGATAAA